MPSRITINNCQTTVAIIGESKTALENGQYTFVSQVEETIAKAEESGKSVMRDFAATAALLAIMASKRPFHVMMDDPTWSSMSRPLQAVENTLGDLVTSGQVKPAVFPTTPLDLPSPLVEDRIEHLLKHPNIRDIPTLEELNELCMAEKMERAIETERFRNCSLEAQSWEETLHSRAGCQQLKIEVERRLFTAEGNPEASKATLNLLRLAIRELDYAIEHHPDNLTTQTTPK